MLHAVIFVLIALVVLRKLAPSPAFVREFASLLQRPERGYAGLRAWLTLTQYTGGEHEGRPVTLVLHPNQRHRRGYLILGLATTATFAWSGSTPTEGTTVSSARMREALDVLIGRHALSLELAGGWLRATWRPNSFSIFPGRCDPEKWRDVLAHMQLLAAELEDMERNRPTDDFTWTSAPPSS